MNRLRRAVVGSIAGSALWVLPLYTLFASGAVRFGGVTMAFGWLILLFGLIGALAGAVARPVWGAIAGAAVLVIPVELAAGLDNFWAAAIILVIGALAGLASAAVSAAIQKRMELLDW